MIEEQIELAKQYLRCANAFTWNEWCALSVEERALFIEASEQLDIERITMLAIAIRNEHGAATLFSKLDQGDTLVQNVMVQKLAEVLSRRGA